METILLGFIPYLLILSGLFAVVCSLKEYRFFVEHRKARFMISMFGMTGMKIFYVTLGLALVVAGIVFLFTGFPPVKAAP